MIDHISFGTNDLKIAARFYHPVMKHLGFSLLLADEQALDYKKGNFLFSVERPVNGLPASAGNGVHFAFGVETQQAVDRFYEIALHHGGKDAGPPGLRPQYGATYYAAFVYDPEGNKLEAVMGYDK